MLITACCGEVGSSQSLPVQLFIFMHRIDVKELNMDRQRHESGNGH